MQLYDTDVNALRVGDVVEVVGVYSLTPQLISDDGLTHNAVHTSHHIHCWTAIRHSSSSPILIPPTPTLPLFDTRTAVLSHLTSVCGGDRLTAQLVLLACISRVASRTDDVVIGKVTVNVTHAPPQLLPALQSFTSQLLPYTLTIPVTIPALNEGPLYPRKDYDTDSLSPSPLQCKARTLLLLDETQLTEGTLTEVGAGNVRALSGLLQQQALRYDFVYHDLHMPVDVNAILLSREKSVVGGSVRVGWKGEGWEGSVAAVDEAVWAVWREWVRRVSEAEFVIAKEMGAVVEGVFVKKRKEDAKVEGEWLHQVLAISRLLGVSYGEKELTEGRLMEAVQLVDSLATR